MNRELVATFLIIVAAAACNAVAASPPAATATPTAAATPTASATPLGAVAPAEIVAAYCEYKRGYTAIADGDEAIDILVAARDGDPDEWVQSAGPEMVAAAKRLSESLADIVWWGGAGTPAPRTAYISLEAWTSALEASLMDPTVHARYEQIWNTWFGYTARHNAFIRRPGTLGGSCG